MPAALAAAVSPCEPGAIPTVAVGCQRGCAIGAITNHQHTTLLLHEFLDGTYFAFR